MSHVLIAGGCGESRERDSHNTCELLTLKKLLEGNINGEGYQRVSVRQEKVQQPFATLNRPRRGAFLCNLAATESGSDRLLMIVGGCSSQSDHLRSAEVYDHSLGQWSLKPNVLSYGKSCFAATVACDSRVLHCLGGWDGRECLRQVDIVDATNVDDACEQPVSHCRELSTALKNSCCVGVGRVHSSFVVGGWDGRRTLDTIFEYKNLDSDSGSDSNEILQYVGRLPYPIECHACVYWPRGRRILVVGGFDGLTIRSDIIILDPDNLHNSSTVVLENKLKVKRENLCAEIVFDDYLLVLGGWDGYEALRSAEVFKISLNEENGSIDINRIDFYDNLLSVARHKACSIVLNEELL